MQPIFCQNFMHAPGLTKSPIEIFLVKLNNFLNKIGYKIVKNWNTGAFKKTER